MSTTLIRPHGGRLIERKARGGDRERSASLPTLTLGERSLHDLECIASGIYSPLEGFVGAEEYHTVVNDMRLPSGLAWGIPISLQVSAEQAEHLPLDGDIALLHPNGDQLAIMTVTDKFRPDQLREAERVYGTADEAHPGVAAMRSAGEVYLGGPVTPIGDLPAGPFPDYALTPRQTRALFAERDWDTVVAFQTRNPIHRAHEYLTKCALEMVDGLFINPLIGATKADDIPAEVRMRCYRVLLERHYPDERVLLGTYPAAMRYAGPREAILHAISRQNYGCTHFIVGRDHAGVGSYYGSYDAQDIFDEYGPDELAITPLKFEHAFFDTRSRQMATAKTSASTPEERIFLSGTRVREMLRRGEMPPEEFTRREVAEILMGAFQGAQA